MVLFNARLTIEVEIDFGKPFQETNIFYFIYLLWQQIYTTNTFGSCNKTTDPTDFIIPWSKAVIINLLSSMGIFTRNCQTLS